MSEQRTVQRLKNGEWKDISFAELKSGNTFRMFELTGEPVIGNKNNTEFITKSDAYLNKDGIGIIDINE